MTSTSQKMLRAIMLCGVLLFAAACGSSSGETVNASYNDELDERSERALDPEPTAVPAQPATVVVEAPAETTSETAAVVATPLPATTPVPVTSEAPVAPAPTAVPPAPTAPESTPVPAPTAEPQPASPQPAEEGHATTSTGVFPAWYQPPAAVSYVSHRDNNSGERRVQTNLAGGDYVTICNDFRAQAARVGFSPSSDTQCNDPIISWTIVETPSGADSEIQRLEGLSYDVLFVFDSASLQIPGTASAATAPTPAAATEPAPAAADQTPPPPDQSTDRRVLPTWFQPTVFGTDLSHAVEDGVYQLVATGEIGASQTFSELCVEFEAQASAAGWIPSSSDTCGEEVFDGATFTDPSTGFEAVVRNYRGAEITYAFEVGVGLTPAEITAIAFDPEIALLPPGFVLVPGDGVVGLAEGIDDTGAYTSAIRVTGAASFSARCEQLVAQYPSANVVIGSCDAGSNLISLNSGGTTVLLEGDVYTFVTR